MTLKYSRAVRRIEIDGPVREGAVARAALRAFLAELSLDGVAVSVLLCSDAAIRRLNARHRGIDRSTDVLSFPAAAAPGALRHLGDIAVSLPTARRRARGLGVPFEAELRLYLAHGLLHLLGHDHLKPSEARRMARAERELLGGAGLVARAEGSKASLRSARVFGSVRRLRRHPRAPRPPSGRAR
ncbi:MAG: rRNA maturation RNase YbeY [Myxococcales bacterium]